MWGLRSTRIVHADRVESGVLLIEGEKIHSIVAEAPKGVSVTDVGDAAVMAGCVDTHVHINEPGRTEWEGFVTATQAALAGGLTTLVDMPLNCDPVTTSVEALHQKLGSVKGKLHADVGFWAGVVPGNAEALADLMREGTLGGKAFMCHSGIDDFPGSDERTLRGALEIFAKTGGPLLAHAEIEEPVELPELPTSSYQRFLLSRPQSWEVDAIRMLIRLCRETRAHVHIVHLSAADALPLIAEARAEGLPLTVETCPHYLCLSAEEIPDGQTVYKCAPPIRNKANCDALWQALDDGLIDFVVSDHSPCPPDLKKMETGNFAEAWGGISSLELGLPLLWTEAQRRGFGLERIAQWMAEAPSALAGMQGRKGSLTTGADADIVVWNPELSFEVTRETLYNRHRLTPYLGRQLQGRVSATYLRGQLAFQDGKWQCAPAGQILYRSTESKETR